MAQQKLHDGEDPIAAKREQKTKEKLEEARAITFAKASQSYYDAYQAKWSVKHREAFLTTLKQYAFPKLGELPVASIDTGLVLAVLSRSGPQARDRPGYVAASKFWTGGVRGSGRRQPGALEGPSEGDAAVEDREGRQPCG
jgi:hypothetical protein